MISSTEHVNLSIQTIILFNARAVMSTQCLIMLKDYVIMLNTYVVTSTQYPIMLKDCYYVKTLDSLV